MGWRLLLPAVTACGFVLSNFFEKEDTTTKFDVYANVNIL